MKFVKQYAAMAADDTGSIVQWGVIFASRNEWVFEQSDDVVLTPEQMRIITIELERLETSGETA
jgi:hypothetical protein